jgi:hypothetical protein
MERIISKQPESTEARNQSPLVAFASSVSASWPTAIHSIVYWGGIKRQANSGRWDQQGRGWLLVLWRLSSGGFAVIVNLMEPSVEGRGPLQFEVGPHGLDSSAVEQDDSVGKLD